MLRRGMRRAHLALFGLASLLALAAGSPLPAASQAAPALGLVVDGTVLAQQRGVPDCGTLAVAGWVRIHVDTIQSPIAGLVPDELVVMVQCPRLRRGERRRFELLGQRPQAGSWTMFSVLPDRRTPPGSPWWALRVLPIP